MQKGYVLSERSESKGFAGIIILIVVLILVVGGGAYYFGKTFVKVPVSKPQALVSPTPQPAQVDETANWKTYTGKNFTFKYPSNGEVLTDQAPVVYISANTPPYFTFTVKTEDNPTRLTVKQVVEKQIVDLKNNKNVPWAKSQADQTLQTMQEYTSGQVFGLKLQSFDEGYPQKFGQAVEAVKDKIYRFSVGDGSGGGVSSAEEKLLDQILSTFKFLDTNEDAAGRYCGGFKEEFNKCPAGYKCEYEGDYPDAGGKCIKE